MQNGGHFVTGSIHKIWNWFLEHECLSYWCAYTLVSVTGCLTPGQSSWIMDPFLLTNASKVCEMCVSMVYIYIYIYMIHIKPDPCRQTILSQIGSKSTWCCQPDPAPFWHIMAYFRECQAFVTHFYSVTYKTCSSHKMHIFIQSHVKCDTRYHSMQVLQLIWSRSLAPTLWLKNRVQSWVNWLYFQTPCASSFLGLPLVKIRHKT